MTHTYCAVYKCNSKSRKEKGLRFHKFPRNPQRRAAWIEACARQDLKTKTDQQLNNMRVCCLHFEKYMYGFGENQLIDMAIPTLNLPPSSVFSVYTQTDRPEENRTSIYPEFHNIKIKTEVLDIDTNADSGMEHPNESVYSQKRIKIENDVEIEEYKFNGGQIGIRPSPDVTVEQFLRGCELYLTPELRQYVKTQIIIPH